jgi:PAS domain S-box-containing protein
VDSTATILIADDDPQLRKTLSDILRAKGYAPSAVARGRTALDRVKKKTPAVALIDLRLQDMDGLEVIKEIKEQSPDTESIVLTGYASQESAIEAVNLGAYSYLQKPYDMEQLLLTIHRALEKGEAERGLRESEERYRTLFEESRDAINITTREGQFLDGNQSFLDLFGYAREEMMELNVRELYADPADRVRFQHEIEEKGAVRDYEAKLRKKDGTPMDCLVATTVRRAKDGSVLGYQGIIRDITGRKRAEEELKESEEKFRSLAEQSPNMIFINKKGKVVYANKECAEIMGYKREEFYSPDFDFLTLVAPESTDLITAHFSRHMRGEEVPPVEYALITKEGKRIEAILATKLIRYGGESAILGTVTDITERKRAEEELEQSFERSQEMVKGTVNALASMAERRDPYTAGHQKGVACLARAIAEELGLSEERIEGIDVAGTIHDIGKIYVPAEILSKPDKLTDVEFGMIRDHPQAAHDVLNAIAFPWPVAQVVLQHHESIDGSGYPQGLSGDEILLEARILAVADVVEAMAHFRPYRPARGIEKAVEEIQRNRGALYDPEVVDACLRLFIDKGFEFEM